MYVVVYTLEIKDGFKERNEFESRIFDNKPSDEEIEVAGNEILKERFPGEELSKGYYWDEDGETAGCIYSHDISDNPEVIKFIKGIL